MLSIQCCAIFSYRANKLLIPAGNNNETTRTQKRKCVQNKNKRTKNENAHRSQYIMLRNYNTLYKVYNTAIQLYRYFQKRNSICKWKHIQLSSLFHTFFCYSCCCCCCYSKFSSKRVSANFRLSGSNELSMFVFVCAACAWFLWSRIHKSQTDIPKDDDDKSANGISVYLNWIDMSIIWKRFPSVGLLLLMSDHLQCCKVFLLSYN